MKTEEQLRKELTLTLENEPNNYSKIMQLSADLASHDKSNVRFSVDAGIVDRLGRELVGKKETAVAELVKNAYDADAKTVNLIFSNTDKEGGTLTIIDDGIGMTKEELVKGFMKISSTDKVHNPKSPVYKRSRAGRKGIGRFSVQRLGEKFTIVTQKADSDKGLKVMIDWNDYSGDKDLFSISNSIQVIDKKEKQGTTLIIDDLRDKWTRLSIERVYRYVSDLIQPFPLSKEKATEDEERVRYLKDPGFKASFFKEEGSDRHVIADDKSMILDYAVGIFKGSVSNKGESYINIISERLDINETVRLGASKDKPDEKYNSLKNVDFEAYYFINAPEFIPNQQKASLRGISAKFGGIRLYRNGFRVMPYGEEFDDWLGLDESEKRRSILPPHGNAAFFGFVEVEDPEGLYFEETSSREGLLETESFDELRDFVYRGLLTGVIRIGNARDRKIRTGQKDWEKRYEKPIRILRTITEELKKQNEGVENRTKLIENFSDKSKDELVIELVNRSKTFEKTISSLEEVIVEQEKEEEIQFKEVGVLRVLASLGLSIGIFTHEIRHYLASIHASVKLLAKKFKDDPVYQERVNRLYSNVQSLRIYTSYFDKTVSENVARELIPQEVPVVVAKFFKVISLDKDQFDVEIQEPEVEGTSLFTIPMHSSEWATILYNLYTNSLKAIKRAGGEGKIHLKIGRELGKIYLEFIDNGDGIPEDNRDKIFEAFYTTSTSVGHATDEQDEILGTGLGLKIVKDIVEAYKGDIEVMDAPSGYSTCIRIEIPEATDKDLEKI
ncbi:signal transduction histidine kinase [Pontibacter ummariensis]|uniref:histidine kinase n=1 Tax=Pontibacter ummariensis TaxID=1610492 RepID=A0A239IEB0_9BACT|nr:sensor histidine kinase [Pontibacter ummariensis]PRY09812.1 signal transduction histidine kinase [Pontibacter ummariensis]SNS91980.1 Signal transduction histidine kinase [Pontibacter ummariensis]